MPKNYKTFEIPTGQDPANLPFIFEQFINSGMKTGSVIAHFATLADANSQIANFPNGSMAWVGAVLFVSNGSVFQPVLSPAMGYYTKFASKAARDTFYAVGGGGGAPAAGQLAMVGSSAGGVTGTYLTMYDGVAWQDSSDLMLRNRTLTGGTGATAWAIGLANGRKVDGWAVGMNGNTFVDGILSINGDFYVGATVAGGGSSFNVSGAVSTNFGGPVEINENVRLTAGNVNVANIGPWKTQTAVNYYGTALFYKGMIIRENLVLGTGFSVQAGGFDVTGASKIHGAVETENLQVYGSTGVTGNVVYGGSLIHFSDRRMKTDIAETPQGALGIVEATPVRSYSMAGTKSEFGWVAQEVQENLPSAVTEMENERVDEEGDLAVAAVDGSRLETILGIDLHEMTAALWKAVQELSAEVKDLRAQLGALNANPA